MSTLLDLRRITAHLGRHLPEEIEVVVADSEGDIYPVTALHVEGKTIVITIGENMEPIGTAVVGEVPLHDGEQTLFEAAGVPEPEYVEGIVIKDNYYKGEQAIEVNRSSVTGQFVSDNYAEKHPDITVTEAMDRHPDE